MTSYSLEFRESALKEWKKLSKDLQIQFYKKLQERLHEPHIPSAALSGAKNCYKIKLRAAGYRLIYQVHDKCLIIEVIGVGKRDKDEVYKKMLRRLN